VGGLRDHGGADAPGFSGLATGVEKTPLFGFEQAQVAIVQVWGLPMPIADYSSQVFPPLLMAAVLGLVYKGLKKSSPRTSS
jgi:PTS system beta-glucosides-specific IIC component